MLFSFLKKEEKKSDKLNEIYSKIKSYYDYESISDERKKYLQDLMQKNGYLPYPHIKALEELTDAEVVFALEFKWQNQMVLLILKMLKLVQ